MPKRSTVLAVMSTAAYVSVTDASAVLPALSVARETIVWSPPVETSRPTLGNGVPDCWQRGGYGTNTASYALGSDAFDGVVAQHIDVTSLSSGGRRLVTAQDTGACAPAITVGHRYTVSAEYTATVAPKFTIYYRDPSGQWAYFAESPSLPTSSTYRQATYTTPAMPSGATAISFGLMIYAVGSLTMDTYHLVDADAPVPTDTAPPSIVISCNGTICSPNPYTSAVSVSLAGWDASGVRGIQYSTDGSDPTSSGTTYSAPFSISSTAMVRALATDDVGNTRALTKTITVTSGDTTPPALSIACNGAACSSSAYSAPVSVTLAVSDASGISGVRYTTDGSDPAASGSAYAGPFTVAATSTVRAIATDNAGNATTLEQTITITSGAMNLLNNPSLETDANGDQVPDCWQRAGFGTNTATFAFVSDAFDGARAENVTITSFTSGARRLVSTQDSGACAPAATPGRTYTMTAHYKANVQPKFSVYYRNSSGTWVWFAESTFLPTASSYMQATYTTPPLPAGATAISIGLSIFDTGSLTSDAYTLVEN